ncbi:FtsB family cell division protein [Priestia koreensis]|uniref:FtsB family cell division protein n=1 Tax=Priestia koreensis TaxID=284581 RepID=UPI001F575299|nr:septum formation initiator family protein [Priestia koreensis]MCM3006920.1 septum formation initiator family protein [Priestia koreensis]UNL85087.1 septum formation initiator family protein [Priestia koreensis]
MSSKRDDKVSPLSSDYMEAQTMKKQNKSRRRVGLTRRLIAFGVIALIILGSITSVLISQHQTLQKREEDKKQLHTKIAKLDQKEKQLKDEIAKLNDEEYIKKIARRDYFLSENGEIIFNIKKGDKSSN